MSRGTHEVSGAEVGENGGLNAAFTWVQCGDLGY